MQNLHLKLTSKYPKYNNWHQTKHHNKVHWGVFIVFTFLVFITISRWTPISLAADTVAPTTPANLTATAISSSQINLSWTASTDNTAVTGYKIYRCAGLSCSPTVQIATSATNSYSDTGLTASTAYTYAISAFDAAGNESGKSGSVSGITQAVSANPIDNLRPGEWYEVPNSKLASAGVLPNPLPPGYNAPQAIMEEWSGGAYDTKRDRLIIWGGGHGGYGGNEIYEFNINTLKWSRLWGPSPDIPAVGGTCNETYSDGNPASRHTYDGLEYISSIDKFWSVGGSLWCGSGGRSRATWTFDFNTQVWQRKSNAPSTFQGDVSALDPATGHIFHRGETTLDKYDPVNDSWTMLKDVSGVAIGEEPVGAFDPNTRMFVLLGNGYVWAYNITTGTFTQPTTTGGSVVVNARGPGLTYDPVLKKIVGWAGGTSVYSLDTTTWVWTEHKAAATNTVIPTNPTRVGVFGRFQYIPSKNAYIVVNSTNGNVFIYKLSEGTGTPPPDSTLPTVSISSPLNGATVSSIIVVSANAADNVGVVGVQFKLDGANLGAEDTIFPYSISWDTTNTNDGSHTLTAVAKDTAGNTTTSASVTVTVSNIAQPPPPPTGQLDIPVNTWVAKQLPYAGLSPEGNIKDLRLAYNSDNGLIYIFGGDHGPGSGRTEMYSYSVLNDKWNLVHPVCLSAGMEQPQRPDEGTFVYDTTRKLFWWVPGFSHQAPDNPDNCPSTFVYRQTMSFDPSTTTWTSSNYLEPPTMGSNAVFGQYDPSTDMIIRLLGNGQSPYDEVYDPSTKTWSSQTTSGLGSVYIGMAHQAIDVKGRKIYTIDAISNNLWIYDIGTRAFTKKAVPFRISDYSVEWQGQFNMRVFWDSTNEILLFPQINGNHGFIRFHTYKPSTDTWEIEKPIMTSPAGLTIRGNSGIYDPKQNVLMMLGGSGTPNPYLFLYRYGNGSGTPTPPDTTAPTIPTNLTATPVSSTQINLSWTASTDTGGSGLAGYRIYRCTGSTCTPTTQIGTSAINSYSNTGLTASTAYTYAVSAYDAAGNESVKSSSVSATTLSQFKQADFNKDGVVNQLDFDILKQEWGRTDKPPSDINYDGIVDSRDLGIMMSEWTR